MSANILDILSEYGLNNTAELTSRLEQLTSKDWDSIASTLDNYYSSLPTPQESSRSLTPLTFCFASLPPEVLSSISTHILFSDKVFLDDPLYDQVSWLVAQNNYDSRVDLMSKVTRKAALLNVARIIAFYLSAKELIQENKLVLYKQITLPEFANKFEQEVILQLFKDKRFAGIWNGNRNIFLLTGLSTWRTATAPLFKNKNETVADYYGRSPFLYKAAIHSASIQPLMSSLAVFAMSGGLQNLSTDFIRPEYAYAFRRLIEISSHFNKQLQPDSQILLPAGFSINGIQVPVLHNVPIERVLDCIYKEPMAFEAFRTTLNSKLLQISAPLGTREREKEILGIKEDIQKDLSDISLVYEQIQKSFSKKFTYHLALGISSIMVAGLSTIGQNLDTVAVAGSVFAGATLSASVKDFVKDWLDYQQEILKLKSKENFFVWKMKSDKF